MASAIPLAVSFLSSMAAQHPGLQSLQKVIPVPVSVPPQPTAPMSLASAPTGSANTAGNAANNGNPGTSPPSVSTSTLCETCRLRPKYHDGSKVHPYCSKSCANKTKNGGNGSSNQNSGNTNPSVGAGGVCEHCHNRPKYFDGTKTHPYCSKACAKNAGSSRKGTNTPPKHCRAPGCQKPPFTNTNGSPSEYCSLAHKTLAENTCLICRQAQKQANSHFCSKVCNDDAEKKGPTILEVPVGHVTFKSVADQFKASWRHGTVCPPVRRIYKIFAPQATLAAYNAYRATVEAHGQFIAAGRSAGNENRRWHGTRRECKLGNPGQIQFCSSPTCSLCCIVRNSFDLSLFGKKTGWGRFGKGIYTSSTSSKSNDYSHNDCTSNLKAILLNKVIVGKGCKMAYDNTSLTAPPAGYDSVLAEKGGSLNYDELVVYTNDAIRPSFLVMYEP